MARPRPGKPKAKKAGAKMKRQAKGARKAKRKAGLSPKKRAALASRKRAVARKRARQPAAGATALPRQGKGRSNPMEAFRQRQLRKTLATPKEVEAALRRAQKLKKQITY